MPLIEPIVQGDISIALWQITESEDDLLRTTKYSANLPKNAERRKERLATVALLQSLGLPSTYQYDTAGRPYYPADDIFISITHTTGVVAVAYSSIQPVGVDIELINRDYRRVSAKYLTSTEALQANHYTGEHYALIWCAKEAIYKLPWGKGLVFSSDIEVKMETDSLPHSWVEAKVSDLNTSVTLKVFFTFIKQYCLAWVGMNNKLNGDNLR